MVMTENYKKQFCIYYYKPTYYFVVGNFKNYRFNKQINSPYRSTPTMFLDQSISRGTYNLVTTYFNKLFNNINYIYYARIKYSGKGYRLYVKKKILNYT